MDCLSWCCNVGDWHGADQSKQAAAVSSAADSIRFLGFVPDEDLPPLYRVAGALEEVIGDGALVIDPELMASISAALVGFGSHAVVAIGLRGRGFTNARRFQLERNAEAVAENYKSVVLGSA
ncbi:MAG: hypothetical protein P8J87_13095 [Verrucomicrobiales bacterium]|nr:hypothetical protein [Verrucomicrobiales bacterium]